MKSKFEKEFKDLAYRDVPDKWDEIKEKTKSVQMKEKPTKNVSFNRKSIISLAASIAVVIFAVSVVLMNGRFSPEKEEASESFINAEETEKKHSETDATNGTVTETDPTAHEYIIETKTRTPETVRGNEITTELCSVPTKVSNNETSTTGAELYHETDWDKRSLPEKFPGVVFTDNGMGREYVYTGESRTTNRGATQLFKNYTLQNRNPSTDKTETADADIYLLEGFDKRLAIGVRFEGEELLHIYINVSFMPQTLGEFLKATDYDDTVSYAGIELHPGAWFPVNADNAEDIRRYLLSDGSVKNISEQPTGEYVSVIIKCEELGILNKSLRIYESGYITTNLIGYQYTFFAGKDKTEAFLKDSYNISFSDIEMVKNAQKQTSVKSDDALVTVGSDAVIVMTTKAHFPE